MARATVIGRPTPRRPLERALRRHPDQRERAADVASRVGEPAHDAAVRPAVDDRRVGSLELVGEHAEERSQLFEALGLGEVRAADQQVPPPVGGTGPARRRGRPRTSTGRSANGHRAGG